MWHHRHLPAGALSPVRFEPTISSCWPHFNLNTNHRWLPAGALSPLGFEPMLSPCQSCCQSWTKLRIHHATTNKCIRNDQTSSFCSGCVKLCFDCFLHLQSDKNEKEQEVHHLSSSVPTQDSNVNFSKRQLLPGFFQHSLHSIPSISFSMCSRPPAWICILIFQRQQDFGCRFLWMKTNFCCLLFSNTDCGH